MPITKDVANKVLSTLDQVAGRIEGLAKAGKVDPRVASQLVLEVDTYADRFQAAAFGPEALRKFKAKVLQSDKDEPYMKTFDNPNKVIESDADEKFMHKTETSFNMKGIDTYDQDRSSTVTERKEYDVRDVSDLSDGTKKQPSWSGGSAGKSTRQGSQKPQPRAQKTRAQKTWA